MAAFLSRHGSLMCVHAGHSSKCDSGLPWSFHWSGLDQLWPGCCAECDHLSVECCPHLVLHCLGWMQPSGTIQTGPIATSEIQPWSTRSSFERPDTGVSFFHQGPSVRDPNGQLISLGRHVRAHVLAGRDVIRAGGRYIHVAPVRLVKDE